MPLFLYLVTVIAGVSIAIQQVLNASLRGQIGSIWWAGFTSYLLGTLIMLAIALPMDGLRSIAPVVGRVKGFSWAGGFFGAVFIGIGILMVPRLGAATTLTLLVVGQPTAAVVIDHFGFLGVSRHVISPPRVLGVAMLIGGAILVRR